LNDTSLYRSVPVATTTSSYVAMDWDQPWGDSHRLQLQLSHDVMQHDEPWYVHVPYVAVSPELGDLWRNDQQTADAFLDDPVATCASAQVATNARLRNLCLKAVLDPAYTTEFNYTTNQDYRERRTSLEISDTWLVHPRLRLVGGVQGMYSAVDSLTFLNGPASNTVLSVFAHGELRLARQWLLNLGASVEDDEHAGRFFLPRTALSWQFRPNQVVRLVHSRAVRTPDIFEDQADWHYYATTDDRSQSRYDGAFYMSARSDGTARSERVQSNEVSYYGNFGRVSLDVRLFRDEMALVSNRLEINRFMLSDYQHYVLRGGEIGSEWRITPFQRLILNYARLGISSSDTVKSDNMDLVPRHSGTLTWARYDPDGWRASATYGFYNNLNRELFFDRLDLHLGRVLPVGERQQLDLGLTAQVRLSKDPELRSSNGSDSPHKIWATAAWRY
ncbi:MAG: TonB-dependent receptor, partial [Perlucidibaca sp.]